MQQRPGNSERDRLAESAAARILDAFEDYNARFSDITRRARRRFEKRDRPGMHRDMVERIELYDVCIRETFARLEDLLGGRLFSHRLWRSILERYAERVESLLDAELYKTFFNTLSRRLFKTTGVDPAIEFVALDIEPTDRITHPVARHNYIVSGNLESVCARILSDYAFSVPLADKAGDVRGLAGRMRADIQRTGEVEPLAIELMKTIFYREGRAYLVGRIFAEHRYLPCVIALVNDIGGIRVDALLTRHRQISVIFGYTQSYFHADLPTVGDTVVFLRTLLPHKPLDELYTVLGRLKQGKTERYRHFFRHLADRPAESLETAAGIRGLVMAVFTLPSYPLVFKVIRDRFGPEKPFGREHVVERYRFVYRHARVGRLVDAQEFRALRFPAEQMSSQLIDELEQECGRSVRREDGTIVLEHCYAERRVRPLNLYLSEKGADTDNAVIDFGQAIKDLARSNIFPGDLLLKNFGVTRTGRVVFYDYDEVCLVTDCRFRRLPEPRSELEALSDEIWFTIGEDDVFPEQFPNFLGLDRRRLDLLGEHHAEIFDPAWWRAVQDDVRVGGLLDVRPYPKNLRIDREQE